jgi:hypothetical protein
MKPYINILALVSGACQPSDPGRAAKNFFCLGNPRVLQPV